MEVVVLGALGVVGLGLACCLYRIVRGPSAFDRVLAFDAAALNVVGAILLDSILIRSGAFLDVVLVVTLLGFLGTIALTAFLEGRLGE
ncbi:monovalent cation/H+ antiporter complex subunit F [Tautonia plasticadhaerens]|uniref:Na(+)/H(+) antiporter subunit F n=1 Tax=Tautonia plasticadhaerens TaxID=2527974 RepID=A0A518H4S8_9BACT|nr:monovalent cation/H+ antiporter complex subunit F [Tautonia plasticadhaerens]QDV35840.1 Na(+)/H(+) antiporter subunit F [Tautonia plasticadhaerens]